MCVHGDNVMQYNQFDVTRYTSLQLLGNITTFLPTPLYLRIRVSYYCLHPTEWSLGFVFEFYHVADIVVQYVRYCSLGSMFHLLPNLFHQKTRSSLLFPWFNVSSTSEPVSLEDQKFVIVPLVQCFIYFRTCFTRRLEVRYCSLGSMFHLLPNLFHQKTRSSLLFPWFNVSSTSEPVSLEDQKFVIVPLVQCFIYFRTCFTRRLEVRYCSLGSMFHLLPNLFHQKTRSSLLFPWFNVSSTSEPVSLEDQKFVIVPLVQCFIYFRTCFTRRLEVRYCSLGSMFHLLPNLFHQKTRSSLLFPWFNVSSTSEPVSLEDQKFVIVPLVQCFIYFRTCFTRRLEVRYCSLGSMFHLLPNLFHQKTRSSLLFPWFNVSSTSEPVSLEDQKFVIVPLVQCFIYFRTCFTRRLEVRYCSLGSMFHLLPNLFHQKTRSSLLFPWFNVSSTSEPVSLEDQKFVIVPLVQCFIYFRTCFTRRLEVRYCSLGSMFHLLPNLFHQKTRSSLLFPWFNVSSTSEPVSLEDQKFVIVPLVQCFIYFRTCFTRRLEVRYCSLGSMFHLLPNLFHQKTRSSLLFPWFNVSSTSEPVSLEDQKFVIVPLVQCFIYFRTCFTRRLEVRYPIRWGCQYRRNQILQSIP